MSTSTSRACRPRSSAELADELRRVPELRADAELQRSRRSHAIRAEPIVAEVLAASGARGGLLPALLPRLARALLDHDAAARRPSSSPSSASRATAQAKTAGYLERLEDGELEPARVSRRVFDALAPRASGPARRARGRRRHQRLAARAHGGRVFRRRARTRRTRPGRHLELLATRWRRPAARAATRSTTCSSAGASRPRAGACDDASMSDPATVVRRYFRVVADLG